MGVIVKKPLAFALLAGDRAADREAQTTLGATAGKHLAALGGGHTLTEAVLVNSLSVRGLECTFHCLYLIVVDSL